MSTAEIDPTRRRYSPEASEVDHLLRRNRLRAGTQIVGQGGLVKPRGALR